MGSYVWYWHVTSPLVSVFVHTNEVLLTMDDLSQRWAAYGWVLDNADIGGEYAAQMPWHFAGFGFRHTSSDTYLVLPLWSPVVVTAILPGVWLWRKRCRHCNRNHFHGPGDGHREAHCDKPGSPYHASGYNLALGVA